MNKANIVTFSESSFELESIRKINLIQRLLAEWKISPQ